MRSLQQVLSALSPPPSLSRQFGNGSSSNTSFPPPPLLPPPPLEPPPYPPPPPAKALDTIIGVDNVVSDASVLQTMWVCSVLGLLCVFGFSLVHMRWRFYKIRMYLDSVSVPPPTITKEHHPSLLSWFVNVLTEPDVRILATAGLDALMLVKVAGLGIKIFVPFTFIGLVVLVPMHRFIAPALRIEDSKVKLSMYSMGNVQDENAMFWLHFVLTYLYIFYVMALLRWQYYSYVKLRQHYMVAGNDVNYWRQVVSRASFNKRQQYVNLMSSLQMVRDWKRTLTCEDEEAQALGSDGLDPEQIHPSLPTSRATSSLSQVIRNALTPVGRAVKSSISFRSASLTLNPTTPSAFTPPATQTMTANTSTPTPGQGGFAFGFGSRPPSKAGQLPPLSGSSTPKPVATAPSAIELQLAASIPGASSVQQAVAPIGEVRPSLMSESAPPQPRTSGASMDGPGPVAEAVEQNGKTPRDGKLRKTDSLPLANKDSLDTVLTHRTDPTSSFTGSLYTDGTWDGTSAYPGVPEKFKYGSVEGAKWWTRVLMHISNQSGRALARGLLSKPSVRHRTTINTIDRDKGIIVSVNAAQYTVLVTDVGELPYPEQVPRPSRGRFRFGLAQRAVAHLPAFLAVPILRYVFLTVVDPDELDTMLAYADESTDKIVRIENDPNRAITHINTQFNDNDTVTNALHRYSQLPSPATVTPGRLRTRSFTSNFSSRHQSFAGNQYREIANSSNPHRPPPIIIPTFSSPRSNFTSPNVSAHVTAEAEVTALSPGSSTSHNIKPPVPPLKFGTAKASTPVGVYSNGHGHSHRLFSQFSKGHSKGEGVKGQVDKGLDSPFQARGLLPTVLSGMPVKQQILEQPYQARKGDENLNSRSSSLSRRGASSAPHILDRDSGPSKWDIVRDAIVDGRLFHLEADIVTRTFRRLFPNDFDRAVPVFRHDKVDYLLMRWDHHQRRLEHAYKVAEEQGVTPYERVCCDGCCLCCNCCACCSLKREPVESIPYHEQRILELEDQIVAAQHEAFSQKFTPSYIAFFKTQMGATLAANSVLHAEDQTKFQVHAAPGPENVNWEVLWFNFSQREARSFTALPVKLIVLLFPISILSGALTSLDASLCQPKSRGNPLWPYYCRKEGEVLPMLLRLIVTGLLPSILLSLWQNMVIPRSLHFVAQMESKSVSLSGLEERMLSLYYVWTVVNVVQGVLGQVFMSTIRQWMRDPAQIFNGIFDVLGKQLPMASNFFFNYVWYRGVLMLPYRLLVPHMGFWCFLFQLGGRCRTVSRRDIVDLFNTRSIRHGIELGLLLYIFTVGFVYCLVSPLMCPVVLAYFACAFVMWRNGVLYLNVRKYESGGSLWPYVFDRLLVGLFIFQLFMTSLLLVKKAYYQAIILLLTVPFILRKFHRHCHMAFEMGVKFTPLELAKNAPAARVEPTVYMPPPLQPGCVGWHPEWMKAWEGFGQPMYTARAP